MPVPSLLKPHRRLLCSHFKVFDMGGSVVKEGILAQLLV